MDNPPTINIAQAGTTIPLKWSLTDAAGNTYANMNALQGISSKQGPLSERQHRSCEPA